MFRDNNTAQVQIPTTLMDRNNDYQTSDLPMTNDANSNPEECSPMNDITVLCTLAVPVYMTPADYLQFIAPMRKRISHFRILRDSYPNRYMVLMKFRSAKYAQQFHRMFHEKPFISMEVCLQFTKYLIFTPFCSRTPSTVIVSTNRTLGTLLSCDR